MPNPLLSLYLIKLPNSNAYKNLTWQYFQICQITYEPKLVIETKVEVNAKLELWREALESKGLKLVEIKQNT